MFCPSCGHEQVNEEIRYCSRCGFSFEIVAQVLANGGTLPQIDEVSNKQKGKFNRSNSWKFGLLWFLFFVLLFAPVLAIAGVNVLPELSALFGFFGAIFTTIFPFIFLKKELQTVDTEQSGLHQKAREYGAIYGKGNQYALPAQQSEPISTFVPPINSWKAPDTFDLVRPRSVTENTTNLLKKNE